MVSYGTALVASDDFQKLELFLAGRSLRDMDVLSKSDPQVVISVDSGRGLQKAGETEVVRNNLNPNFTNSVFVDYIFEMKQRIVLDVLDVDKDTSNIIGTVETTIGKLAGARNQTSILDLQDKKGKKTGKLIVVVDHVREGNESITMQWGGVKLANVDGWFDKSDPFLRFFRTSAQGSDALLTYETKFIKDNLNPIWDQFTITSQKLCNGNKNAPITIECHDYEKSLKHKLIGKFTTTLNELIQGKREFQLESAKKKSAGHLKLNTFSVVSKPSFMEYIRGGEQLGFITAIDFTGSNGIPSHPSSLHAVKQDGSLNQYQQALCSVGDIILNYDFDKKIPIFGFGAKPQYPNLKSDRVVHCFPLTGDPNNSEVFGLQGILQAYQNSLTMVQLSGPTLFEPIISGAEQVAKSSPGGVYTVLLIVTDGEIHDMKQTKNKICECQYLPLSIIIVGVGNEDFENMKQLDCDEGRLMNSEGKACQRDLVQFVALRNYNNNPAALAKDVLAELPQQLVDYKLLVGAKPNPPISVQVHNVVC